MNPISQVWKSLFGASAPIDRSAPTHDDRAQGRVIDLASRRALRSPARRLSVHSKGGTIVRPGRISMISRAFTLFIGVAALVGFAASPASAVELYCSGIACDGAPANGAPANFDDPLLDKGIQVGTPTCWPIVSENVELAPHDGNCTLEETGQHLPPAPGTPPETPEPSHGWFRTTVYLNAKGVYTYAMKLSPIVDAISIVEVCGVDNGTCLGIPGFNGVVGWSYNDALAAKGPVQMSGAEAFQVVYWDDLHISWSVPPANQGFWPFPNPPLDPTKPCGAYPCANTPITFFYQSTWAPATGVYSMVNQFPGNGLGFVPGIEPLFIANAGTDQTVDEGTPVALDGTQSKGPNLKYSWKQISPDPAGGLMLHIAGANTATPSFTAPILPGGYGSQAFTVELTVSNGGSPSTDTVNIIVKNINHAPVALAEAATQVAQYATATLNSTSGGMKSYDPDGDAIGYQWTQVSGPVVALNGATTEQATFIAELPGVYTFRLTVTETAAGGLSSSADVTLTVEEANHAPVADAGAAQTVNTGAQVTLNGTKSTDPDGDTLTYQWTQTAGTQVQITNGTATPSFTAPNVPGDLTFSLVVSDPYGGQSAPSQVTVSVMHPNNPPICKLAVAWPLLMWPPNHKMHEVKIYGVKDKDRDDVKIEFLGVTQDEPTNGLGDGDTGPDAVIKKDAAGNSKLHLRAERSGKGDGRVYKINFKATDEYGASCTGATYVGVPHAQKKALQDSGQNYNSTK
jgi:hypothetical protein